ncbi:MAG: hypothetical protein K0U66_04355, partial [Gammaproteobacteria bacterium]|nr:hypothetical protein [Gammaproteobacteria bacterium]
VSGENACTVTSLPAGLELRTYEQRDTLISSCEIFGTPTTLTGSNNYSITAANVSGSNSASVTITVLDTPVAEPVLARPIGVIALVLGSQQNLPILITNSGGAISENGCTASSGSIGTNATIILSTFDLELSTTDAGCEIRSISPAGPTIEIAEVQYDIDASNSGGSSNTVILMLSITAAAPVLANVDGVKQLTIGTQITPIDFAKSGGGVVDHDDQACELDPSSAALPAGLRLVSYESSSSGNSCRIVGTPLASAIGAVTVSVIGSNPTGQSTATVSMTVVPNAINLVSIDDTVVLVKDSQASPIVFSNLGIGADNCRLFQGSVLPNGLRLSIAPAAGGSAASCQITGTPTTLSPLAVSVTVAATATTVADSIATVSIGVVEEIPAAFIAVAAGARSTCATDSSGRILCWGANEQNGHLGALSAAGDVNYPALLDSSRQWLDLSVAERHACAVSNDHQLHCWGANNFGQLGSSNLIPTTTPVRIGAFQDWSQVSSGTNYTCATRAGQLYCWGDNRAGQLGTGALRGGATFIDEPQRASSKLDWRHVVAGRTHTCAVDYRGGLYCWGESGDWLGLGPQESNRLSPGQVSGMWRSVSVGDRHTCAVALSGSLHCWGLNGAGQLGIAEPGDSAPRPGRDVPTRVGTDSDWRFVEAGGAHTCAVKSTGALYCWGQLSDTTSASAAQVINIFPTQIGSASDWARLSSGLDHACALNNAGRLYCWGSGEHGRTGLLRSSYAATPTAVIRAPVAPTTAPSLSAPTAQLTLNIGDRIADIEFVNAAGSLALNSCAAGNLPAGLRLETYFQSSGVRSCRISGRAVSLVNPPATISVSAVNAAGAGPANIIIGTATRVPVLSGPDELVIYKVGDNVHLVFENTGGSPSGSSNPCRFTAETVDSGIVTRGLDVVPQASSDGSITCALVGQPQIATEEPIDVTVTALTLRNPDIAATEDNILRSDPITFQMRLDPLLPPVYTAVSVSRDHSCAIDNASRMWCWGINVSQKIGINNIGINRPSTIPALITGGKRDWTQVSAAERHTCALDATGKLFCWGSGDSVGNTSIAPLGSTPTPTRVGSQSNWVSVSAAASGRHTCAVNDDGGLYCWGDNLLGQSGAATSTQRVATPRQVGGNVWSSVSAGQAHTCAIRTNNTLYCWGENYTSTPAQVGTASNWVSVDAGEVHTCAIDSTSALYCWGEAGAWLGLGSVTTRQTMPALVGASSDLASGWATVRAGFRFSCAVTTAGKLYCWGKAGAHLGQGSISADVSSPIQVGTQSNWVQLDSGGGRNYENLNNDRSGHSCAINNAGQLRCWGNDTQGQLGLTGAGDSDRPAAVNDGLADVASAPALQSIVGTRTAVAGEFLSPLILRNTGGSVRLGGCSASGNLPTGLTVSTVFVSDHLTCQISGVAAEVMAPVTVSITGVGDAGSAQATVTIAVVQPPVQLVSLTGQANLIEGTPITAIQLTNSGGDAISCANTEADDSPSTALTDLGLTIGLFDDGEGVGCQITGTPTGFTGSRITYGLTATDANGFTSRATVTFRVQPRAPVLSSTAVRFSMIEGVPVSETGVIIFNNTGGDVEPGGCTIGATSAELPSGLSLATVALTSGVVGCQIFGTPTRGYTGDRAIVVDAVNVSNRASASSVTINLAVVGAPQIRSGFFRVPSGEFFPQNVFTYRVQPYHSSPPGREIRFENSGGTLRSCTVTPSLPTGLFLQANSCSIVGSASHRLFEGDSTHIVTAVGLTPALTSSATITIRIRAHAPPNIRDRSVHRDFDLALVGTDFIRFVNDGGTVAENGCAVESSGPSLSSLRMELGVHEGSCVVFTNNNSNFNGGALVNGPVQFTIRARNSLGTTASSFVVAGYSTTDRLGIPSQFRGRFSFDPFRNARFTYSLGTPTFTINQPAMVTFNHIFRLEYADANVNLNEAGAGKQINFIDCRLRNYSTIPEGVLVNPQDCSLFGTPIAAPRVSTSAAVIFEVDTLCCEQPSLSGLPISFSHGGQPSLAASATLNLRQRSGVGLPYLIANSGRAPASCTAVPSGANTRSLDDLNLRISPYRASCVIDSLDGSGPSAIAVGATYTINGSTGL